MSDTALVKLVVNAIRSKYKDEKSFYTSQLGITPQSWDRFKKGEIGLKPENMRVISHLFTDYDWMLVQKVARNADWLPEVEANPVGEFRQLQFQVAKKWLNSGLGEVSWVLPSDEHAERAKNNVVILRIVANYDFWSYKDVIELYLPSVIRTQLGGSKVELLEYMNTEGTKTFDIEE